MLNTMESNFFQPKKKKKTHFSFRYLLEHAVTGIELMDVGEF